MVKRAAAGDAAWAAAMRTLAVRLAPGCQVRTTAALALADLDGVEFRCRMR